MVLSVLFGGLLLFSITYLITSEVLWLRLANLEVSGSTAEDSRPE